MRFVCAVVGLVAMSAMGVQAQHNAVRPMPRSNVVLVGSGCPGLLSAKRQAAGGTVWTVAREDAKDPGAKKREKGSGAFFELKSAQGPLREVELSVNYLPPGGRVMPVETPDAKDVRTKTFDVAGDGETNVEGNLLVGPAFEITRVHLMSATFANGSVWRAPSERACSVAPDGFLPVVGK